MDTITSPNNRIVKAVRALRGRKGRDAANVFLAEGIKFVAEIGYGWDIRQVVLSETFYRHEGALHFGEKAVVVTDQIFAGLSDVVNPQGILAVVEKRDFCINKVLADDLPLIFVLEDINDPGNLGTILRNCHGLGATGIILAGSCADIYSPKAVRASAGSIFHVPFAHMSMKRAAEDLKGRNIALYATSPAGEAALHRLNLQNPTAFALGNEHNGLTPQAMDLADETVQIPVISESLNVSIACAICAYEAWRQRNV